MSHGDRIWLATGVALVLWMGVAATPDPPRPLFGLALGSVLWVIITLFASTFPKR